MTAATYMGQLRSAVRAYALDLDSPSELIGKLARFAEREESRMATMIYATLNLDTWVVRFARAGHPYPLLVQPGGKASFLTEVGGPPLGAGVSMSYEEHSLTLAPGETLVLYTDGLIERRGAKLSQGEEELLEVASSAPEEPELKCRTIVEQLTADRVIGDDVAILAVQSLGLGEQLEVVFPARTEQLAAMRHLLRRWVTANGGTDDDCAAFAIAVTEACANAVQHAYGPGDADVEVGAELADDVATVTIRDRGRWRDARGEGGGRGMEVMREFMDEMKIERGDQGTTVELQRRIGSGRR
jgi:anti-sigma regulatory factor (Ser/Thr protein kinase)